MLVHINKRNGPTYFCQPRQINQRQVKHIWAVYTQRNRQLANPLVLSCYTKGLLLNFFTNLGEVGKLFVDVQELAPLPVRTIGRLRSVYELQNERSTCNNSLTARKEVATDNPAKKLVPPRCGYWLLLTFLGHLTFPTTGCPPFPSFRVMIKEFALISTYHDELGHIQLSALT